MDLQAVARCHSRRVKTQLEACHFCFSLRRVSSFSRSWDVTELKLSSFIVLRIALDCLKIVDSIIVDRRRKSLKE